MAKNTSYQTPFPQDDDFFNRLMASLHRKPEENTPQLTIDDIETKLQSGPVFFLDNGDAICLN